MVGSKCALVIILTLCAMGHASAIDGQYKKRTRVLRSKLRGNVFVSFPAPRRARATLLKGTTYQRTSYRRRIISYRSYFQRRHTIVHKRTMRKVKSLQDKIVAQGGCPRSVCFTLDASEKLSQDDQKLQKDFVAVIAATLGVDSNVQVAACNTSQNCNARLQGSLRFLLKSKLLGNAMRLCSVEMMRRNRRTGSVSKMVVIGNGRESFGQRAAASSAAHFFRRQGGGTCGVAVKGADRKFFADISGGISNVLSVSDYTRFDTILGDVVKNVCDFQ
eukprot:IDg21784t1